VFSIVSRQRSAKRRRGCGVGGLTRPAPCRTLRCMTKLVRFGVAMESDLLEEFDALVVWPSIIYVWVRRLRD
jgi:hypothetical protein